MLAFLFLYCKLKSGVTRLDTEGQSDEKSLLNIREGHSTLVTASRYIHIHRTHYKHWVKCFIRPDLVFAKKEMIETIEKNVGQIVPLDNASSQDKGNDMHGAGHAKPYTFANGRGTIGYIPSIEPFSNSCGRIRLKFDGKLLPWLFEKQGYDLRSLLREGQPEHEIKRQLREDGKKKPQRIIMIIQESNLRPSLSLMHR